MATMPRFHPGSSARGWLRWSKAARPAKAQLQRQALWRTKFISATPGSGGFVSPELHGHRADLLEADLAGLVDQKGLQARRRPRSRRRCGRPGLQIVKSWGHPSCSHLDAVGFWFVPGRGRRGMSLRLAWSTSTGCSCKQAARGRPDVEQPDPCAAYLQAKVFFGLARR